MASCPFCNAEVDEVLVLHGGTCPKCFGEIPGEEAPTDPGERVRAEQVAQDRKKAGVRGAAPLIAGGLAVFFGLVGLTAFVFFTREEVLPMIDDAAMEDFPIPDIVAETDRPPVPEPEPRVAEVPKPPKGSGGASVAPAPKGSGGATKPPAPQPEPAGIAAAPSPAPDKTPPKAGLGDLGVGVSAVRRGEVLSDPEAIRAMVGQGLTAQVPRTKACYNLHLKTNEGLAGKWRLSFFVNTDGRVSDPKAEGLSQTDAAFEACLAKEMGSWRFDPINAKLPVQRTVKFGADG